MAGVSFIYTIALLHYCTIAPLHHCTIARCGFEGMGIRVGSPIKAYLDAVLSLPATDPSREDAWGVASSICGLLPGVMESFCDGTGCVSGMLYTTHRERERERERGTHKRGRERGEDGGVFFCGPFVTVCNTP